jgi:acyl-coenzyme A synthetase/AMP-(fatty) acid ligase
MRTCAWVPLHRLLNAARPPQHPVCQLEHGLLDWSSFRARAARLAQHYRSRPEQRWLLAQDSLVDFGVHFFALLSAGRQVVIPANTQPGTLERLSHAWDAAALAAEAESDLPGEAQLVRDIDPDRAIIDIYTSGSTGEPKCVRKTLAQFEAEVEVLESLWGRAIGDAAFVASVPHQHIYGLLFRLFWPLAAGRVFDNVSAVQPDALAIRLRLWSGRVAPVLISSPAQLSRLPELLALNSLPAVSMIFSSGAPLPESAATAFRAQTGSSPTEVFGSTETGGIAWRCRSEQADSDLWSPFPGLAVSADTDGALLLRSPFLGHDEVLRMDDAIAQQADGRFRLQGRLDRVVKVEGKRLSLPDLESSLAVHEWVSQAAVVLLAGRRQVVGAAVVLSALGREALAAAGPRAFGAGLRRHLAARFDAVVLPRRWRFLSALPLSERGKLEQQALAALFAKRGESHVPD